jgi:hypothetical protein
MLDPQTEEGHMARPRSLALVALAAVIVATPPATLGRAEEPVPRAERGLQLLVALADRARQIPDKAQRFLMMARVADALWPHDADRARKLASRAFDESVDVDPEPRATFDAGDSIRTRKAILKIVQSHDPALAARLAERIDRGLPDPDTSEEIGSDGSTYERAAAIASTDPKRAAEMVRRLVAASDSTDLDNVLRELRGSDPGLARTLALETLALMPATGLDAFAIQAFVFPNIGLYRIESLEEDYVDLDLARPMLAAVAAQIERAAVDRPLGGERVWGARNVYLSGQRAIPFFERYAPERIASVRTALARLRERLDPDEAASIDAHVAGDHATATERMVALWTRQGDDDAVRFQRDGALTYAADEARSRGDFAKARDHAAQIHDEERRRFCLMSIVVAEMWIAERAGQYENVARLASEISDPTARAVYIGQLAAPQTQNGRVERSMALYEESYRLLTSGGTTASWSGVQVLIGYAQALRRTNATRAFEIAAEAVAAANRADPESIETNGPSIFDDLLAALALVDTERAISTAASIHDPYDSTSATMSIAQALLADKSGTAPRPTRPRRARS